jgi:manganese transport protein
MTNTGSPSGVSPSLPEVHASVSTEQASIWRRMFAFAGPAYLVSVGYMDPGNWATDIEGGARFGYELLWVLVMSNLMAILLQTLSARLGIVSRRDLAQACRETYPRTINFALWVLCEIAIAACDLAEVLGAAIGLNLLFGLPLLPGVLLTSLDILMLLWLSRFGIRMIEGFVLSLIAVMAGAFLLEILMAKPLYAQIATGIIPRLNNQNLYIVIGIVGATVMPHNLYLHSALVQTRRVGVNDAEKRTACRFNLVDSVVALNGAMFVNIAILVLAGAVFFQRHIVVTEIQQAYQMLSPLLGTTFAGVLFGVALLCSGQSSTMTGTMAGQIVMEGFLTIRMRPWLRRLTTRTLAIVPAAITIYVAGDQATFRLLILSQVILSMQLPFAVIPLLHFTSDRKRMGVFANRPWVQALSWLVALIIVVLNVRLVYLTIGEWLAASGPHRDLVMMLVEPVLIGLFLLLVWMTLEPWLPRRFQRTGRPATAWTEPPPAAPQVATPAYRTILVPLDHTERDRGAIAHAATMARAYGAKLYLLHVEEGVTSQIFGSLASTAEVQAGQRYLDKIVESLRRQGLEVEVAVAHSRDPKEEIVRYAREIRPDLVVMGAHGHKGIQDVVFGQTINAVRHELDVPLLIVRNEGTTTET